MILIGQNFVDCTLLSPEYKSIDVTAHVFELIYHDTI